MRCSAITSLGSSYSPTHGWTAMLLGEVFDRFAAGPRVPGWAGARSDPPLAGGAAAPWCAERAARQYTRELLFSQLVDLMGLVACRVQPSRNAAIRQRATDLGVTRKAVYAQV